MMIFFFGSSVERSICIWKPNFHKSNHF